MSNGTWSIQYGRDDIVFDVLFVKRKSMEVAVHPDSSVVIKAPIGTATDEIEKRVLKRARWIRKQLAYFGQFHPRTPQHRYIGGESHLYLGRQYRLKLIEGDSGEVKLSRGYFWITCKNKSDPKKIKNLLDSWYLAKAREKFIDSFDRCWPNFERLDLAYPRIQIRRMKTRWGSLSHSGTLTLNVSLIRAPRECIDYVITHELCHLKYHDHSPDFYKLLDKVMPDWERRKHKLELALI
ncbi:MAG: SprT family zinc-dependent metalloprotease [Proteobacteria bacterium]|nr:SprT family zinc-dependent metalloprotease [Pseudomonadota bacterium]